MEIAIEDASWTASRSEVESFLAGHLHRGRAARFSIHVDLSRDPRGMQPHSGSGFLTVPSTEIGDRFLSLHGTSGLSFKGRTMRFSSSGRRPRADIVQRLRILNSFMDPRILEDEEHRHPRAALGTRVDISELQFGWDCRDGVLSIESEASPYNCHLDFDTVRRRFFVEFIFRGSTYTIAISMSQIESITAHHYERQDPVAVFSLAETPTFKVGKRSKENGTSREQLSFLPIPKNHCYVVPYVSLIMRLVFPTRDELQKFRRLTHTVGFRNLRSDQWRVDRRALFSKQALELYSAWFDPDPKAKRLPWIVAFQVESIVRKRAVDVREMLDILPDIKHLVKKEGERYVAAMLQEFSSKVTALYRSGNPDDALPNAVRTCFENLVDEYSSEAPQILPTNPNGKLWQALHVTVTPTTMILDGPYPERSNRVIRSYPSDHHNCFLRVSFAEEGGFKLRFDRDVDGEAYIQSRVRTIFSKRLEIARREFEFLAYSQSALKEHTVWFVKPFKVNGDWVRARDIIQSLGRFDSLRFDPTLSRCPARYAARISQAFTSTSLSVTLNVQDIVVGRDMTITSPTGQKYDFTDGVGTMSPTVACEACRAYGGSPSASSSAFQVRVGGAKGMVSTDYRLQGRTIVLRPSMIKFEAPHATSIEIAGTSQKPIPYFLNRPLIMMLEGLDVQYEIFKEYQDRAVRETEEAANTLSKAAEFLRCHGLGTSFNLSSTIDDLFELGVATLQGDHFFAKALSFAQHHVLRDLKHKARIPIPGAWTLVGVADVHEFLKPNQVFVCVKPLDGKHIFLQGPVVVSRSPTIHPGDVQIAEAIGPPPRGSSFEQEPLANTIVFSVKGDRPLPSCLGGGDLDGDIYNIIPLDRPERWGFRPKTCRPSSYAAAKRKLLTRQATLKDVAEFVMDYMLSDMVGIIATNWLITADTVGIHHPDCIKLANLHSNAVDYPKSGNPVNRKELPRLPRKQKPDWSAPETYIFESDESDEPQYYESQRAIGKLFRAIKFPPDTRTLEGTTRIYSLSIQRRQDTLRRIALSPIYRALLPKIRDFVRVDEIDEELDSVSDHLFARYKTELQGICITRSLSFAKDASLTEEEVVIGTIVQKTSSPQRRKYMISVLRDNTDILVPGIREVLEFKNGPDDRGVD